MVLLDSFWLDVRCVNRRRLRQVTLLSRELLKTCKDQTQQDCTSDAAGMGKLFRSYIRKWLFVNALQALVRGRLILH